MEGAAKTRPWQAAAARAEEGYGVLSVKKRTKRGARQRAVQSAHGMTGSSRTLISCPSTLTYTRARSQLHSHQPIFGMEQFVHAQFLHEHGALRKSPTASSIQGAT